ncbi:MAG: amino acid ABC transporter substrate-binding protein [Spirochaetaceae bacterium]|nr:MAG: amino acid ABC transporter substrate-binding protein [Spirochaetaceae bacterium]
MVRKKVVLLVLMAVIAAAPLLASGRAESAAPAGDASALERTVNDPRLFQPGKLTVGTGDPVYPPWMLNNDPAGGEGFENGLIYALAEEMGFSPEDVVWVGQTFDQAIAPGPKPYDFAIQQISVTEERSRIVTFSQVYFQPDKAVVALPGSAVEGARSYADLRRARWGATIGTTDLDYLEGIIGVQNVAVYDDQVGTFQALQGGLIDATVVALPTALFATAVQIPEARITALLPADPNDRGHGLLFQKDNPLVEWVDEALSTVIARGVVDDLVGQYLVGDASIPEINR